MNFYLFLADVKRVRKLNHFKAPLFPKFSNHNPDALGGLFIQRLFILFIGLAYQQGKDILCLWCIHT
jgi:hypothetical protein